MKKLIIAGLLTLTTQVFGLNVAVSNVVHSYQTDAQREVYVGRSGESVYNTDRGNLTIFGGSTTGGVLTAISGENVFYVRSTYNAISNATEFLRIHDLAQSYYDLLPDNQTTNLFPKIIMGGGTYNFTTNLCPLTFSTSAEVVPAGKPSVNTLDEAEVTALDSWTCSVVIQSTTNAYMRGFDSRALVEGIKFECKIVSSSGYGGFSHCEFDQDVASGSTFYGNYNRCAFYGGVYTEYSGSACAGIFTECFVPNNAANTNSFWGFSGELYGSVIMASDCFGEVGDGYISDCYIDGGDIFHSSPALAYITCMNTRFKDSSGDWCSGAFLFAGGDGFFGCTDMSSGATNSNVSIKFCTDETGAVIPNQ